MKKKPKWVQLLICINKFIFPTGGLHLYPEAKTKQKIQGEPKEEPLHKGRYAKRAYSETGVLNKIQQSIIILYAHFYMEFYDVAHYQQRKIKRSKRIKRKDANQWVCILYQINKMYLIL
ncbi:hypothetical protein D1164_04795 [Mariniphaga sediminis]|uniref:Uncharacterized protein n=1 Tax=Mariniphaga sediminis TaxID=1628158 RepID=A0A399D494_9BACT|nr:hypothetical protein [Mariniphaga sediminis]RIH66233.1 hypothetical protein D1164_04795 [Mariniphaga sediminis]